MAYTLEIIGIILIYFATDIYRYDKSIIEPFSKRSLVRMLIIVTGIFLLQSSVFITTIIN